MKTIILALMMCLCLVTSVCWSATPIAEYAEVENVGEQKKLTLYSYPKYYGKELKPIVKKFVVSDTLGYDWMIKTGVYHVYIKNDGTYKFVHGKDNFEMKLEKFVYSATSSISNLTFSNPVVKDNTITWTLPNGIVYQMIYSNDTFRDVLTIPENVKKLMESNDDKFGISYTGTPIEKYIRPSFRYQGTKENRIVKKRETISKDGKYIELEDMTDIKNDKDVVFNASLTVDYTGIEDCENYGPDADSHREQFDGDGMWNTLTGGSRPGVSPVRVDLSSLPSGSTVSAAKLSYKPGYVTGSGFRVVVYSFDSSPGTIWDDTASTWNNYDGSNGWTDTNGGQSDVADALNTAVTVVVDETYTEFNFNATGLTFVENGATDDIEMLIINDATLTNDIIQFRPIETGTEGNRPKFEITYTAAAAGRRRIITVPNS